MNGIRTLVLGNDMMPTTLPITHIASSEATKRVLGGTCVVVSSYDHLPIKTRFPEKLRPFNLEFWPSIIARTETLRRRYHVAMSPENLMLRDNGKCQYCGLKLTMSKDKSNSFTRDHVFPKSKGGKDDWTNIVSACPKCNSDKSDSLPGTKWVPLVKPVPLKWSVMMDLKMRQPLTVPDEAWIQFLGDWKGEIKVVPPTSAWVTEDD